MKYFKEKYLVRFEMKNESKSQKIENSSHLIGNFDRKDHSGVPWSDQIEIQSFISLRN